MTEAELTAKIQAIETSLQTLTNNLQALQAAVNEASGNNQKKLEELDREVKDLRAIEDTKTANEIADVKARVDALVARQSGSRSGIERALKALPGCFLTYWSLLAFVGGLIVAVYVYRQYGVGYFEEYEKTSNTKKSSQYYRQIGDALLPRAEFKEAEQAYKTALAINPNDIDARHGLLKTQVLNPLEGNRSYTTEVVEAKLKYLESLFPDDYLILYYKGVLQMEQNRNKEAGDLFILSRKKNAGFVGSYLNLGLLELFEGKVVEAKAQFETALQKAPNHARAGNYLGVCHLLSNRLGDAVNALRTSADASLHPETLLNLGDAYRAQGDFDTAAVRHEEALELFKQSSSDKSAVDFGAANIGYLPLIPNDPLVRVIYPVRTPEQYKALINYALSIDYALQNKSEQAEQFFEEGYKLDRIINGEKEFGCLYLNRAKFILNARPPNEATRKWLDLKMQRLTPKDISCFYRGGIAHEK